VSQVFKCLFGLRGLAGSQISLQLRIELSHRQTQLLNHSLPLQLNLLELRGMGGFRLLLSNGFLFLGRFQVLAGLVDLDVGLYDLRLGGIEHLGNVAILKREIKHFHLDNSHAIGLEEEARTLAQSPSFWPKIASRTKFT
jgi:hypothetical protein